MNNPISEDEEIPYSVDMADFIDIDEGLCWECVHCENCCGNIFTRTWLDTALKEYIGEPIDRYCKHYDRKNSQCLIEADQQPHESVNVT
ncbi:MAG: hypothetical protein U9R75_10815 [Candidatus Thermoplasmatota archaeon]|nr:hypothetical protein [Candidatus Thermoplasmatota archaeon]